jgi:hypothetical protein
MIRLIHHSSNMSLNILPESTAFPGADIPDPFSALNTPMDDKTRAKKIATGKKILHDFRMTRKIPLNDGGAQTDTPAQDTDSSVFANHRLPLTPSTDPVSQPIRPDLRNPVSDRLQHDYSGLTETKSRLRTDTILSSGDKYVITFRGNARFLAHNNFQHYTDNENMQLVDIRSLITAILDDIHVSNIIFYAAMCPSVSTQLEDSYLPLPQLNRLCLSLTAKAMHVDVISSTGQSLPLGMLSVAKVGDLPSNNVTHREAYYYTPSWYQEVSVIGIPPRLPAVTVPTDSYFRVTFTRNTNVRVHDQIQHFSSTSTIYHIQTWLSEILNTVYDAPLVYPETQLHFLKNDPVLASTNLSDLMSMQAGVSLHVLSKSPLIHTDASEVTRIFFGHYTIHHCNASLNGREHIHLFDRREQLDSSAVRISQAEISTTVPFRLRTPGYDTDRLNFHAYVIRFCTVLPDSHPSWPRYSSFEYLEFDNKRGFRHIRWLISQTTAINNSQINLHCPSQPRFRTRVQSSNTMGDLCDLFAHTRDQNISVVAEPMRGVQHTLGYLTVERVGTLRPQMQPPYLTGTLRFVESYADYDDSGVYCDTLSPQIPQLLDTVFEIALYLPYMSNIITKDILGSSMISDIMT